MKKVDFSRKFATGGQVCPIESKMPKSPRKIPISVHVSTQNTKTGVRPSAIPTGAAPYSSTNPLKMTARVGMRGYPKRMAGISGRTIAINTPCASAATICRRKMYLFQNSITRNIVLA